MKRFACLFSDGSMNVHCDVKGKTALQLSREEAKEWNDTDPKVKEADRARVVTFDLAPSSIKNVTRSKE